MLLRPCLALRGRITQVREFPAGQRVSYGGVFTTERPSLLGTLPIGYADGYRRCWSSRASVLIRGRRCPVAGTVTMDQILVDCGDLPGIEAGADAVLLGSQGEEAITAEELAAMCDTINYEVTCGISGRVPREYGP